jgi:hypothetical protein
VATSLFAKFCASFVTDIYADCNDQRISAGAGQIAAACNQSPLFSAPICKTNLLQLDLWIKSGSSAITASASSYQITKLNVLFGSARLALQLQ